MFERRQIGITPPQVMVGDLVRMRLLDGRVGLYEVMEVGSAGGLVTMKRKEEPRNFMVDSRGLMVEDKDGN